MHVQSEVGARRAQDVADRAQGNAEGGGSAGRGPVRQSAVQSVMLSRRVVPTRGKWPKLCPL